ncbi:MAG: hypothetical protein DI534_08005 [Leifsonia xyli]|nr:MAG: hypothetical protein DI534_08005 [Leifsonia xyli]
MTRATVLIPTHHAPESLSAAVESALAQTVSDIEILIVGDGVGEGYRQIIEDCIARDPRVRFLDLPKGANRGERNRHEGVLAARSEVIAYLADDDLLLPRHLDNVLDMLADADICQPFNGYIDRHDQLCLLPADLADPAWHAWHLLEPPRNRVSITGTAHTRAAYLRLPRGWDLAAPGMPTDLTLWRQFFALDGLRGRTHTELTVLQLPASERAHLDAEAQTAQRERWTRFLAAPEAHDALQELVRDAMRREHLAWNPLIFDLIIARDELQEAVRLHRESAELAAAEAQQLAERAAQLEAAAAAAGEESSRLRAELDATRATLSWRVTAPLRAVRQLVDRSSTPRED